MYVAVAVDGSGGDMVVVMVAAAAVVGACALPRAQRHRRRAAADLPPETEEPVPSARHSAFSHSRCFRTKDIASARRAGCGHKLPEATGATGAT